MDLHLDEKCTNGVWFTYGFYNGAEPGRIRWRSKKIFKNLRGGWRGQWGQCGQRGGGNEPEAKRTKPLHQ